jgi:hypothetical protein
MPRHACAQAANVCSTSICLARGSWRRLQGQWKLPGASSYLTHMIAASPSDLPGAIEVHHLYDVFEQGGQLKRTSTAMTLAVLSYGDVIGALANAGFSVEALYGGHDLTPFQNDSARLIVDARLPRA